MRYRLSFTVAFALAAAFVVSGCNIFGSDTKVPGSEAGELQKELDSFLGPGADGTISSETLLEVSKQSRLHAEIGVLQITRELSQSGPSGDLTFPFDTVSVARRVSVLENVRRMDEALALILYANRLQTGGVTKAAQGDVPDYQLRQAAKRVELTAGIDPCGVYTDFLITRLLKVLLEFRTQLDKIPGITPDQIRVIGTPSGYHISIAGSITQAQADVINGIIDWLTDPATGVLTTQVKVILRPEELFGCQSVVSEIIDVNKVEAYIDNTLITSLRNSYVHAGTN